MKTLFAAAILALLLVPVGSKASGTLVKSPSFSAVYYLGADGKRYVFPNENVYKSWYGDFSGVTTISDNELYSLQIGGNVTYKPGSKMVKITTDPKVYAVDRNGTLRWIVGEQIATELYGAEWARNVHDIPDAFFVNYKVGEPITKTDDFSPEGRMAGIANISEDRIVITPVVEDEPEVLVQQPVQQTPAPATQQAPEPQQEPIQQPVVIPKLTVEMAPYQTTLASDGGHTSQVLLVNNSSEDVYIDMLKFVITNEVVNGDDLVSFNETAGLDQVQPIFHTLSEGFIGSGPIEQINGMSVRKRYVAFSTPDLKVPAHGEELLRVGFRVTGILRSSPNWVGVNLDLIYPLENTFKVDPEGGVYFRR